MTKKLTMAGIALVAVCAFAFVAIGSADYATACDKAAKNASAKTCDKSEDAKNASAKTCDKSEDAKNASAKTCDKSAAKTASAQSCDKSAAKTASAQSCDKSAAKTASAQSCDKSAAKTASAGCCAGAAAKTASASGCSKSSAAKTASADCCEGKDAVAGYSKAGKAKCDTKECPASECNDKYAAALNKVVDEIPQAERTRLVLTGTIECGHCTYDAVGTCQPLLKTADGKVYPMLRNNIVKSMKKSGADQVEVKSNVRIAHGVKYLDVKTFKAM